MRRAQSIAKTVLLLDARGGAELMGARYAILRIPLARTAMSAKMTVSTAVGTSGLEVAKDRARSPVSFIIFTGSNAWDSTSPSPLGAGVLRMCQSCTII